MTRLLIVTDAWRPQVNGVVRTLEYLAAELERMGITAEFLTPAGFRSLPCPTYPEIRLALATPRDLRRRLAAFAPDYVHVATEGPLGMMMARISDHGGPGFTTSYHTRFPEYLAERVPVPLRLSYAFLRRFHNKGLGCMVATGTLRDDLSARGFRNLMMWGRGVDQTLFRPQSERVLDLPGPIFLNVGRIAPEKNIEAFLDLDLPGTKVVVGDGPALPQLRQRYPDVHFLGMKTGEDLARIYASADVFVFPSLTDTFGNVLLEAMACGVPVAAYPVMGPLDVVGGSGAGVLDRDLRAAALAALECRREAVLAHAEGFTWRRAAEQFMANVVEAQRNRHRQAA